MSQTINIPRENLFGWACFWFGLGVIITALALAK